MTETPQFSSFSTQPFDALAQQQPSQGQITSETEFVDMPESFTPISASRFPNKKNLRAWLQSSLFLHSVSLCISSGIHPHQQTHLQ